VWCQDCGTLVQDRGRELELISVPRWADPEALAELYTSIIQHREKLLLVIGEIEETRDEQKEIYGAGTNREKWYDRLLVVLKEVTGPEDATIEEMRLAHDAAEGGGS